ncbi:MAG: glycosyltransferase, partial [bacterium]|nr:glycosyltransferase [bacterium]
MNNRPLRIVMMTNTYLPHVGGVAKSVHQFTERLRERGHRVLVTAPEFDGAPQDEIDVIRTPAIQRFNGSDFSVRLPIPMMLTNALDSFNPDVIHSHHPFLMGDTALRSASHRRKPLIFTHHTLYEQYTHYVPGDSPAMRRFAIELGTSYANLCDRVIAPSQSIESILTERGVIAPITVIPTGVDLHEFAEGDGARFRHRLGLEKNHILIGHVGRLAPEKNLEFLARSVAGFIQSTQSAHFAVVGDGPSRGAIENAFHERSISERLHCTGKLSGRDLIDAYAAMDVFAFASLSETQGMVVSEAMAGGAPVVALDAPGVREVVTDGV